MSDEKEVGLIGKYYVVRADGDPTGKHTDCPFFVLDPVHDPIAQSALNHYAFFARKNGYIALADDLEALVTSSRRRAGDA